MIKFNFQVPIKEADSSDGETEKEFIIEGTAINATTTGNNHKYLEEELEASAHTLNDVPLLKDHRNEVDYIMGRVKEGRYSDKKVIFKAKVIDKNAQEMIKDGRLNSVSVGATLESFEEDEDDGSYVARGITFKELSLVAVGADEGATFGMALSEAYKLTTDTKEKKVIEIPKEKADETAPDTVTKEELADTVAKAVAEALAKEAETRKTAEAEKAKTEAIEKEAEEKKKAEEKAEADKIAKESKTKEEAELKAKEKAEKEAKEKAEKEAAESDEDEDEDDDADEKSRHKIIESTGALKGGALTIERG